MNTAPSPDPELDAKPASRAHGLRALAASPAALALAYAAFGLAWVLLSDHVLRAITADIATLSAVGEGKGIAFVLMTSGLFYLLATHQRGGQGQEAQHLHHASHTGGLMWVFAALCAAIVGASVVSYAGAAHEAYALRVNQLRREAQLKADLVRG